MIFFLLRIIRNTYYQRLCCCVALVNRIVESCLLLRFAFVCQPPSAGMRISWRPCAAKRPKSACSLN